MPTFGLRQSIVFVIVFILNGVQRLQRRSIAKAGLGVFLNLPPLLINRHVFVVVLQRLSILCDLDGIRIENPNRDMLAAEFYRTICRGNPAFEGGTAAFVAHSHLNVGPFKWPNSNAILFA